MSGMLLIACMENNQDKGTIAAKMAGIALASISSGGGDLSFLGLTHFYGHLSLAAWASDSGAAGLVGSSAYVAATVWLGFNVKGSLLLFSLLPIVLLLSFFIVLPKGPLQMKKSGSTITYDTILGADAETLEEIFDEHDDEFLMTSTDLAPSSNSFSARSTEENNEMIFIKRLWKLVRYNLHCCHNVFISYMLHLLLVYLAEYIVNQGITPTLLYPLAPTPFEHFRDFYPTYIAIYQTGAFIARSSISFVRFPALYIPSFLQYVNLAFLFLHAMFNFILSVYIIFIIVFWEGFLGGLAYVNTFAEIIDNVPIEVREFSLGATSASDSTGVCIASVLSIAVETFLCSYQIRHGRDFGRKFWLFFLCTVQGGMWFVKETRKF